MKLLHHERPLPLLLIPNRVREPRFDARRVTPLPEVVSGLHDEQLPKSKAPRIDRNLTCKPVDQTPRIDYESVPVDVLSEEE